MTQGALTLWGMGTVRQLRPHWMLEELGLEYDYIRVHPRSGQTHTQEFLKLNPRHKVPVLRHGTFVLTESLAIIEYLAQTFPNSDDFLVPDDAQTRARVTEWSSFVLSELDSHSLYVIRRHTDLAHLYGEAPVAVEAAREYFHENIRLMAPSIGENGGFLFGDRLTIADIMLVTCLDWAVNCDLDLPNNVRAYRQRAIERPAYMRAFRSTFDAGPGD